MSDAIREMYQRWQDGYAFCEDSDYDVELAERVDAELASPPAEALPSPTSGAEAVREAARTIYFAFDDYRKLPAPVQEVMQRGGFFSALRLLFDPDADLSKPLAKPASEPAGGGVRDYSDLIKRLKSPTGYGGTSSEDSYETFDPLRLEAAEAIAALSSSSSPAEAGANDLAGRLKLEAEHWSSSTLEDVQDGAKLMAEAAAHIAAQGDVVACLLAEKPFWFDPATNFVHADDGGAQGVRWAPSPAEAEALHAGVEARRNIAIMRKALREIAEPISGTPIGDPWAFYADLQAVATAALSASAPAQEDGSKDLGRHPRGSGQSAGSGGAR